MKKCFLFFQNGGFFLITYFSGKSAFLQISADFVTEYKKLFFSSDKDSIICKELFCSSRGSGDIREKHNFQNQVDCFFCYLL